MLRTLDNIHKQLFESLEIGLVLCEMDGTLVFVNEAYASLLGLSKEQVFSKTYWEITPKKYAVQEAEQLESLNTTGKYGPFEKEYIHATGNLIPVRLHGKTVSINGVDYIWSSVEDISFSKSKETQLELDSKSKLIEASLNEIFIFDMETLKFVYVNKSARKNIGYSMEELSEMTPLCIKPEIDTDEFMERIQPLYNGDTDVIFLETIHQRKDGTTYFVDIHIKSAYVFGRLCYSAFILDNTIKKELQLQGLKDTEEINRSRQYLKGILDQAAYAIIITDIDGIITIFNKAAELLLGYQAYEVEGKLNPSTFHLESEVIEHSARVSKILNKTIEPGFETFVALSNHNHLNEYEWTYVRKDGDQIPVLLLVNVLRDTEGNITGYCGMATNITERKEKENELILAKDRAELAVSTKNEFLANISHEIRTPMNGIIGMSSLLADEDMSSKAQEKVTIIRQSAESLLAIINDILDLSKIESGKFDIINETFNIRKLSTDIIELAQSTKIQNNAVKLQMTIDRNIPDYIISDPIRIRQILNNLLSNALKFTNEGNVTFDIKAVINEHSQHCLRFIISDTGIGIAKEHHEKLFKNFSQVDTSTTRRYEGTGLGLAITKNLVELLNGHVEFRSDLGKGTTFIITLPYKASSMISINDEEGEQSTIETEKFKILLVEDNKVNQMVAKGMLQKLGHVIDIAEEGLQAVQRLEAQDYDVVFMDCHMPVMDGFEATQEIIQNHGSDRPYIIALTASSMPEDRIKCQMAGMDDFISKPVNQRALSVALAKFQLTRN